ncbi:MAG TPA: hypothetical protein VNN07_02175 [Candidatus Tectomicrobia bacterium]|nr:hypothetical protein [Candidatus Tectomicrobia bacterium]
MARVTKIKDGEATIDQTCLFAERPLQETAERLSRLLWLAVAGALHELGGSVQSDDLQPIADLAEDLDSIVRQLRPDEAA